MNDSRFEWKVGLFVFVGLALSALLILNFSKGLTLFRSTYQIHIIIPTVAGLKPAADVMMAGVPIGKVVSTTLSTNGRSVDITVEILAKQAIQTNASFHIDELGFLGDPYIEVTPAAEAPAAAFLTNGATVAGDAPFNMQEAVRSISGLVDQGQKTMKDIDKAVNNVNNTILDAATLTNFVATMNNFQGVTSDAASMAKQLRGMLDANGPSVHVAITNFAVLSGKLDGVADQLQRAITTVSASTNDVTEAVKHINAISANLQQVTDDLRAGQGLAGDLLKNEKTKADFAALLAHINEMTEQYAQFGRSLNEHGFWWHLWHATPSPTNAPAR